MLKSKCKNVKSFLRVTKESKNSQTVTLQGSTERNAIKVKTKTSQHIKTEGNKKKLQI